MTRTVRATSPDEGTVRLELNDRDYEIRFSSDTPLSMTGETQALVAAPVAMRLGLRIEVDRPVAPGFSEDFKIAQAHLAGWFARSFSVAPLVADNREPRREPHAVSFFSGGVDSYYTALQRESEIDSLVLIHGFDTRYKGPVPLSRIISEAVGSAAADLGKPLIEVTTDVRKYSDSFMGWGPHYHAMALAAVAHLLGATTAFIPSTYAEPIPWGSHPDMDPYLGGNALHVVHDSAGVTRFDKLSSISENPSVMRHLRVCYRNKDGQYNCGDCEKCIRTMLGLAAIGRLESCPTFSSPLEPEQVRRLRLAERGPRAHARQNHAHLRRNGADPELQAALRSAIRRGAVLDGYRSLKTLVKKIPGVEPVYRALLGQHPA